MSNSIGSSDSYPGQDLSISQLLHAVRKKLQDTLFGRRCGWMFICRAKSLKPKFCRTATTLSQSEVKETDVLCCAMIDTGLHF